MMLKRQAGRLKRKQRIRKKILGTSERPRLSVFRSSRHVYAQIIDDSSGRTLIAASTLEKTHGTSGSNRANAEAVGKRLGEKAKAASINEVIFDRNGYLYHGCVKSLADGAREAGLKL